MYISQNITLIWTFYVLVLKRGEENWGSELWILMQSLIKKGMKPHCKDFLLKTIHEEERVTAVYSSLPELTLSLTTSAEGNLTLHPHRPPTQLHEKTRKLTISINPLRSMKVQTFSPGWDDNEVDKAEDKTVSSVLDRFFSNLNTKKQHRIKNIKERPVFSHLTTRRKPNVLTRIRSPNVEGPPSLLHPPLPSLL